jgi:hypothetical protein
VDQDNDAEAREPFGALLLLRKIHARSFLQLQITVIDLYRKTVPLNGRSCAPVVMSPPEGRAF